MCIMMAFIKLLQLIDPAGLDLLMQIIPEIKSLTTCLSTLHVKLQ